MRKQTMIAAAVVAAAMAGPAIAQGGQAYQSAEHKFSLTMPEGWTAQPLTDPSGPQVQFNAPSGNSNCNVFKVPYQPWAAYSQTQINNEIANNIFKGEIETEMNQAGQNGRPRTPGGRTTSQCTQFAHRPSRSQVVTPQVGHDSGSERAPLTRTAAWQALQLNTRDGAKRRLSNRAAVARANALRIPGRVSVHNVTVPWA